MVMSTDLITPKVDNIQPSAQLVKDWLSFASEHYQDKAMGIATYASQWGYEQGHSVGLQKWPDPIKDRPPTSADGDYGALIQVKFCGVWNSCFVCDWRGQDWAHTPCWRPPAPKQPTLREEALAQIDSYEGSLTAMGTNCVMDLPLIRRALESIPEVQDQP